MKRSVVVGARGQAILWLLLGGLLMWAADGGSAIAAIAAWFPAIFVLRFTRLVRPWLGYLGASTMLVLTTLLLWRGVIPLPPAAYVVVCLVVSLLGALPYLFDRLLASRLPGWTSTLVFPAAWCVVAGLAALGSPFGTWGSVAYTQAALPAVARIVSLSGVGGLAFLIAWLAAAVNHWWATPRRLCAAMPLLAWGFAFSAALIVTTIVLTLGHGASRNIRVAAIAPPLNSRSIFQACRHGDENCIQRVARTREDLLFSHSAQAAAAGAQLLLWSEGAAEVSQPGEDALIQRGRHFAQAHQVYLVMGLLTVPDHFPSGLLQDKLLAITPAGQLTATYFKNKAVPGEPIRKGSGRLGFFNTPFGRVALSICFDADFPALIHQASRGEADLLLNAAADWPRIAREHASMATFRGMENGIALLRATGTYSQQRVAAATGSSAASGAQSTAGLSLVAEATGHIVAEGDASLAPLIVDLPVRSRVTPYRFFGNGVQWLSLFFLMAVVVSAIRRSRRLKVFRKFNQEQ